MADSTEANKSATVLPYTGPPHPDRNYATIFADGAMSIAFGNGVVKFHLFRQDPSFLGDNTNVITPLAQIVMPYGGFLSAAIFLRQYMETMKSAGAFTQEMIDQAEAVWSQAKKPLGG